MRKKTGSLILGTTALLGLGSVLFSHAQTAAGGTLEQWYHQYGEAGTSDAVKRYAEAFGKATGIKVNVSWIPGAYAQKLNAALAAGNGPDVFEDNISANQRVAAGQIAPLDDILTPELRKDFAASSITLNTVNGKIYGIQMITDAQLLYYRKSMFTKAGLKPPTTFAELLAASKKLTTGGVKGMQIGNDGGAGVMTRAMLYSAGSDLIKDGKVAFNTPRAVKAFEGLRELSQSGTLLIGSPTEWWDPTAFIQGQAAMAWGGLWSLPAVKKALGDDFGVMPWPKFDAQGTPVVIGSGWSEFVNVKSKNLAAAKQLVKSMWIDDVKLQADWNTGYGFHIPPRKSAVAAASKLSSGQAADVVRLYKQYGRIDPTAWTTGADAALADAANTVARSKAPVSDILSAAATKAQTQLTGQ